MRDLRGPCVGGACHRQRGSIAAVNPVLGPPAPRARRTEGAPPSPQSSAKMIQPLATPRKRSRKSRVCCSFRQSMACASGRRPVPGRAPVCNPSAIDQCHVSRPQSVTEIAPSAVFVLFVRVFWAEKEKREVKKKESKPKARHHLKFILFTCALHQQQQIPAIKLAGHGAVGLPAGTAQKIKRTQSTHHSSS